MAAVETCYTSCGYNRTPHCVDWGKNGLICYGACWSIALYKPEFPSSVVATLAGHKGRVESVQWIRKSNNDVEDELVSASADCSAIVWQNRGTGTKFGAVAVLKGHSATVTMATGMYVPGSSVDCTCTLIATTSADSSVKVWQRKSRGEEFHMLQSLSFGSGFALCLEWILLPAVSVPLLACGCDDQRVHLFVEDGTQFCPVHQLWGHEDWVRDLALTVDGNVTSVYWS
ncbi:Elongator complex protein 2 [Lamellibrachia satsuma]|nr:Elongator complex protein 2 [Lamellibrachia satsuma]